MNQLSLDDVSRLARDVLDEVEVAVVGKRGALTLVLADRTRVVGPIASASTSLNRDSSRAETSS